jgi:DNA-binding protein H-NS
MAVPTNLKSMSIEKLMSLREQVESTLASKVAEERRNLLSQLETLSRFKGSARARGGASMRGGNRGSVAPKYRNPDNPAETWAGRGLKPRWLVAAMKGGKKLEHFAITARAKTAAVKKSRGAGR